MNPLASTPEPPYYAVLITFEPSDDHHGYIGMVEETMTRVRSYPGFLGAELAQGETGILISYWASYDAIMQWSQDQRHQVAKSHGNDRWFRQWTMRICVVECEMRHSSEDTKRIQAQ